MAIWEEGGGPTTDWDQEAGMSGNANQENVANLASRATQAASNAEDSENAAALSATAASASATSAANSATSASSSATSATASATSATSSASAASTSASNAATSETNAGVSETNAAASESAAATSESNAATSATNAATSETNAATSEANAAASFDSFDDRYLGAKASDPTLDNDGDPLLTGALYFNSTTDDMKVYDGALWVAAYASIAGITLDDVTTDGDTTTNAITVGGLTSTGPVTGSNLNITNWNTAYGWGDHSTQGYLTSFTESNDLTVAVTWANVPDANITQSSVTQHQAALSVTESQISDLQSYLTAESDTLNSVTGRGASTTNSVTVGGLHVDSTGAIEMPAGTTAEQPSPVTGMLRFNTTLTSFEGYDGIEWGAIGGGGGATEDAFYENSQTLSANVTIASGRNAMTTGPLTVGSGYSVTIEAGCRVVVI